MAISINMNTVPIETNTEYRTALEEIQSLMSARAGSPNGARLDTLVARVEAYEAKHHSLEPAAAPGKPPAA